MTTEIAAASDKKKKEENNRSLQKGIMEKILNETEQAQRPFSTSYDIFPNMGDTSSSRMPPHVGDWLTQGVAFSSRKPPSTTDWMDQGGAAYSRMPQGIPFRHDEFNQILNEKIQRQLVSQQEAYEDNSFKERE